MNYNLSLIRFLVLITFILSFSCTKETKEEERKTEIIKVNLEKKGEIVDFDEYFSSSKVIPLQTNSESVFSTIDRIRVFGNKIFILDRRMKSVFIFSTKGDFLSKINSVGKGPQEYGGLIDFTIDEKNEHIILCSHRPYGLFTYDFNGNFIDKLKFKSYFSNIQLNENHIVLLNSEPKKKYLLFQYDLTGKLKNKFLEMDFKNEIFENKRLIGRPSLTKDKYIHLTFPYSENIYELKENKTEIKYQIDFGKHKLPENFYKEITDFKDFFLKGKENNYGFGINSFRENDNYAIFNFQITKLLIYSKKTKKSKIVKLIKNADMIYGSYRAHGGNDNKFISICQASVFKMQMEKYRQNESWKKVPDYIKQIDSNLTTNDNPLVLIYTFK